MNIDNILCETTNPPNIFTAAKTIARNPIIEEKLILSGPAITSDVNLSGIYRNYGLNPNGTHYSDDVCIEQSASDIFMTWSFNGDTSYSVNEMISGQVV